MQENAQIKKSIKDISLEDKQRLVDVFAWLIQEDKKQNPSLYKLKQQKYD